MLGSAPQFPTLDAWQKMEEDEQDALIARIEAAQRRRTLRGRILIGIGCVALGAGLAVGVYLALA